MICYLDSSVLLRYLLLGDNTIRKLKDFEVSGSSELILIEANRVLQRYRLEGKITDSQLSETYLELNNILDGIFIIELTPDIKARASESFPTVVGTLDAIHLSSLLAWKQNLGDSAVILSHDRQMAICANALGIHAEGIDW